MRNDAIWLTAKRGTLLAAGWWRSTVLYCSLAHLVLERLVDCSVRRAKRGRQRTSVGDAKKRARLLRMTPVVQTSRTAHPTQKPTAAAAAAAALHLHRDVVFILAEEAGECKQWQTAAFYKCIHLRRCAIEPEQQ